jgi:hypothetical protein
MDKVRKEQRLPLLGKDDGYVVLDQLDHLPSPSKGSIYVAGPWRGYPDGNKEIFDAVSELLTSDGWIVYNPHTLNEQAGITTDQPIEDAIKLDMDAIGKCDAICLLPGWRASEGVRTLEAPYAKARKLEFYVAFQENGHWFYKFAEVDDLSVEGIDQTARRYVFGARAQTYGHPRDDFAIIAGMWGSILKGRVKFLTKSGKVDDIDWAEVMNDELVAILMSAFKLARLTKSPKHRDSQVDVVGYQLALARCQEDPAEVAAWSAAGTKGPE